MAKWLHILLEDKLNLCINSHGCSWSYNWDSYSEQDKKLENHARTLNYKVCWLNSKLGSSQKYSK